MRVGISAEFLGIKSNGTATYSRTLLRGLAQLDGVDTFVPYISSPLALPLIPHAAQVRPQMVLPYNAYARLALTLPLELVRRPVDILHAQGWGPVWSPCPMVLTVHDIGWESFPAIYPKALALRLSYQVRDSVKRAVHVIASSHYTADDLVRVYRVPRSKISVIYPATNPEISRVTDAAAIASVRARYGVPERYILYVGSVEPKKNVDQLIRAYAALSREQRLAQTLIIAGKPLWLSESILALPEQLGIPSSVLFTGPVAQEDLAALYSGADVFAFLGMYEGFGYPPLEAMACGTPALVADRTSLPEVTGGAALLVDPGHERAVVDGLARLLADADLRGRLREQGLQRASQFQILPHARAVAEVYAAHARAEHLPQRSQRTP
ncbi:MAG: glycosyltransferase family 4 protein [Roseiflexaceae bacterium]|nr:glycosyltransferase family 4 protein [Roseiflexaceae bacterium]